MSGTTLKRHVDIDVQSIDGYAVDTRFAEMPSKRDMQAAATRMAATIDRKIADKPLPPTYQWKRHFRWGRFPLGSKPITEYGCKLTLHIQAIPIPVHAYDGLDNPAKLLWSTRSGDA